MCVDFGLQNHILKCMKIPLNWCKEISNPLTYGQDINKNIFGEFGILGFATTNNDFYLRRSLQVYGLFIPCVRSFVWFSVERPLLGSWCCQLWPDVIGVTRCDQEWQMWPVVPRCDQLWPDVTRSDICDQGWPDETRCDHAWPDVTESEKCAQVWTNVKGMASCDQVCFKKSFQ